MKDVVIKIVSSIVTDGDEEKMEFMTEGRMLANKGVYRLYYNTDDGSGSDSTMLRAENDTVVIQRSGDTSSRLTVKKGQRCVGHYDVGPAGMMVGVSGRDVRLDMSPDGGTVYLEYAVDINAAHVSLNRVEVTVTPA